MANSTPPGILCHTGLELCTPARTPGVLGLNDQGDPRLCTRLGDTPGCTGVGDGADTTLAWWTPGRAHPLGPVRAPDGSPLALPVMAPPLPSLNQPPWMKIAEDEARRFKGETEELIQKTRNYHLIAQTGRTSMVGPANAWCAAFVNTCLKEAGVLVDNPAFADHIAARGRASAFFKVQGEIRKGDKNLPTVRNPRFALLDAPVFGAIAMVTTGTGHGEHVGFVYAAPYAGSVVVLGGNQSDRIKFDDHSILPSDKQRDHLVFFFPSDYLAMTSSAAALGTETSVELNKAFGISLARLKHKGNTQ